MVWVKHTFVGSIQDKNTNKEASVKNSFQNVLAIKQKMIVWKKSQILIQSWFFNNPVTEMFDSISFV